MPYYSSNVREYINNEIQILELMQRMGESIKGSGRTIAFLCPICGGDWNNSRINSSQNFFKCFKCESEGNRFQGKAINYIQGKLNLSYVAAIEYLAEIYGLDIEAEDNGEPTAEELRDFSLFLEVADFYQTFNGKSSYLLQRGISKEIQEKAKTGYAPGGKVLKDHLLSKGFTLEELNKHSLLNKQGMDRLFNRCVLPIVKFNRVVDFYARRTDSQDLMKHMYMKGTDILYGMDWIKDKPEFLDFYEAPITNLVAMSNGYDPGISIGGCSKFSQEHIKFIKKKRPKKVRIIFDGDHKGQGQTQAFKVSQQLTENKIDHQVVLLPLGNDPADILTEKNGVYRYDQLLKQSFEGEEYQAHFLMKNMPVDLIKRHLEKRNEKCSQDSTSIYSTLFFA